MVRRHCDPVAVRGFDLHVANLLRDDKLGQDRQRTVSGSIHGRLMQNHTGPQVECWRANASDPDHRHGLGGGFEERRMPGGALTELNASQWLGHASVTTTTDRYATTDLEMKRKAIEQAQAIDQIKDDGAASWRTDASILTWLEAP